jgi:hypothetical protein
VLLILSYGLIKSDEYPARPMLMSLLLFPALMALLRVVFRPDQHPQPNPLFEMELATCVMKSHQHDLSAKGKVSGVSSETRPV